jgi:hypothetical protein
MNSTITLDKHETIIDKDYLEELQADSALLNCLQTCGVSRWDGYEKAVEITEAYLKEAVV